jgi:hypothetical protein
MRHSGSLCASVACMALCGMYVLQCAEGCSSRAAGAIGKGGMNRRYEQPSQPFMPYLTYTSLDAEAAHQLSAVESDPVCIYCTVPCCAVLAVCRGRWCHHCCAPSLGADLPCSVVLCRAVPCSQSAVDAGATSACAKPAAAAEKAMSTLWTPAVHTWSLTFTSASLTTAASLTSTSGFHFCCVVPCCAVLSL